MQNSITKRRKLFWTVAAGIGGTIFISGLYFGLVSWAESLTHALDLFWEERAIVIPLFLGFGVQTSLYTILKKRWFLVTGRSSPSGMITGTSGTTSTIAMVACCAHHVTDLLPILGLSAAAAFLARYQSVFMLIGLITTYLGVSIMIYFIIRERRRSQNLELSRAEIL
jgi:hypothetical protein